MTQNPKLLSRREIAAKLKRSPTAVNKALIRMNAKPTFTAGRFEYYEPPVIDKLENSMRRRNYNHTSKASDEQ